LEGNILDYVLSGSVDIVDTDEEVAAFLVGTDAFLGSKPYL